MQSRSLDSTIQLLLRHLVRMRASADARAVVPSAPVVREHQLELARAGIHVNTLELGAAVRIECLAGKAWLTKDGDATDHVLRAGDSITVVHADLAVIAGVPRAEVVLRSVQVRA